jgi:hypothetical protein
MSFHVVDDVDATTVKAFQTFKLPVVFLTLAPVVFPTPTKGFMLLNSNPALHVNGCADVWYADGVTWHQLELCQNNLG